MQVRLATFIAVVGMLATVALQPLAATEPPAPSAPPKDSPHAPPVVEAQAGDKQPMAILPFAPGQLPPGPRGAELQGGLRWRDKSGEFAIVFERSESVRKGRDLELDARTVIMTARHLRQEKKGWKLVRQYREPIAGCPFDVRADLVLAPGDWSLTDLDGNGVMEATWVWFSTCTSDVSPSTKKVMLIVGDQKYPLRGTTNVDIGNGEIVPGTEEADPSFAKLGPRFLEHARSVWSKAGD